MKASTDDKFKKKELSEHTTNYHIHKNLLKMRALYSRSQESTTLPDIINQTAHLEVGKSPSNKINFSENYHVLQTSKIFKNNFQQHITDFEGLEI